MEGEECTTAEIKGWLWGSHAGVIWDFVLWSYRMWGNHKNRILHFEISPEFATPTWLLRVLHLSRFQQPILGQIRPGSCGDMSLRSESVGRYVIGGVCSVSHSFGGFGL